MISFSTPRTNRKSTLACGFFILALASLPIVFANANNLDQQRNTLRSAFAEAKDGTLSKRRLVQLSAHPLAGWLEAVDLHAQIDKISDAQMQQSLSRIGDQPAALWLRHSYLNALARKKQWQSFSKFYTPSSDVSLRCHDLSARQSAGRIDDQWFAELSVIWLHGKSLPTACDGPIAAMEGMRKISYAMRWQRIDLAIEANEPALIRFLARALNTADSAQANAYADYLQSTKGNPLNWPNNERSRRTVLTALKRSARSDPDKTEQLLQSLASSPIITTDAHNEIAAEIALWSAVNYLPNAERRFKDLAATAYTPQLLEWRVREALHRADYSAALAAIQKMDKAQLADSRWLYLRARLHELNGDSKSAASDYAVAALSPSFHGFLAADRSGRNYQICALEPSSDLNVRNQVDQNAYLLRAFELYQMDMVGFAGKEWNAFIRNANDDQRRVAIAKAVELNWFDRAVYFIGSDADAFRYYSLRFPIAYRNKLVSEARHNALDPALVAGLVRAESGFMHDARSHANARGLMQMLPSVGARTARQLNLRWRGSHSLYDANLNLQLGTYHLREMIDANDASVIRALAAYNAGPTPTNRWISQRPTLDQDLWIETIPYHETRDYVARVLAFSVIYDWRLNGSATALSDRINGNKQTTVRRQFSCDQTSGEIVAP